MEQYAPGAGPEKEILCTTRRRAAANGIHARPRRHAPRDKWGTRETLLSFVEASVSASDDDDALNEKPFVLHKQTRSLERYQMTWDSESGGPVGILFAPQLEGTVQQTIVIEPSPSSLYSR